MWRGYSADDEVEGAGVVGGPVGIVLSGDEGVGAEFQGVGFFGRGAGDGCYVVCSECFCVEDAEMAEAADADDTDLFARAAAVFLQGRVEGYAAAEHGGCVFGGDGGGDFEDEM